MCSENCCSFFGSPWLRIEHSEYNYIPGKWWISRNLKALGLIEREEEEKVDPIESLQKEDSEYEYDQEEMENLEEVIPIYGTIIY